MNDKERILLTIIKRLYFSKDLSQFNDKDNYVRFSTYSDREIQKGNLVMGLTSGVSDFTIGFVHEIISEDHMVIKELGSDNLCDYSNERFIKIIGLDKKDLYEKDQYVFYKKVLKAFQRQYDYSYRFGGLDFVKNDFARIWIREVFGGINGSSKPFSFLMKWNKKTTIKRILKLMNQHGYGTRKFEKIKRSK